MTDSEQKEMASPGQKAPEDSSNKMYKWMVCTSLVQIVLLIFVVFQLVGLETGNAAGAAVAPLANGGDAGAPAPRVDMEGLLDDDPVLGDEDAPVTIVEFSDYECPFCARFYQQTLLQIKSEYINTGKVKLVYRDFPLSFHQQAIPAAIAANCAGEQGKYYQYHDKVFSNGGAGGKTSADYEKWAQEVGVNVAKWKTCLSDPKQRQEIQKDFTDGQQAGIQGTPGFFVNGQLISGAQPFEVFQQIIDAELAG